MTLNKHVSNTEWFFYSKEQIFDVFSKLPNSIYYKASDLTSYCYIPGKRSNKVLLIAHVDTVWDFRNDKPNIALADNKYYISLTPKRGIGADDRVGVMSLWALRNLGHSLLLLDGEESGCIASGMLIDIPEMRQEINKHQFAIQFDRAGHEEIVFYNVGTNKFKNYVKCQTGYSIEKGSFSDIVKICKDICGVNISVGYYNEHTEYEFLDKQQWLSMLKTVTKWLKQDDLPRFDNTCRPKIMHHLYSDYVEDESYYHYS